MKIPTKSNSKHSLFANFGWLSASHGINFIIPLIIYPYLLRVIGVEYFGLVMFAQATILYFTNVLDYGFSLSGIRDVSINRDHKENLTEIFSRVIFTKLLLLISCFVVFLLLILLVPKMSNNQFVFVSSFSIAVGQWLLPSWFLQGLEKMRWVAFLNIISKLLFMILIIVYVNETKDYIWVNLWLGVSQIIVGLLGLITIGISFRIIPLVPPIKTIFHQLRSNFLLFISNFSGFVSSNSTLLIFGLIADPIALGYYAIVERILVILKAPAILLYQTVYPQLCVMAEKSMENLLQFSSRIIKWVYIIFIPLALVTCFFAGEIIYFFAGKPLDEPTNLLYIISIIPLIVALNIPPTQGLIAYKLDKSYSLITVSGAIFSILLTIGLTYYLQAMGAALSALITEFCVTTMIYIIISRKYKNYNALRVLNWA